MRQQKFEPARFSLPKGTGWTIKPPRILGKLTAKTRTPLERQKLSKIAFLPDDVLLPIVQTLDETGKARLIQTCRYFQILVEPILYRHLHPHPARWRSNKTYLLHNTLIMRQDLLPYVLSYHGRLVPELTMPGPSTRGQSRWFVLPTKKATSWEEDPTYDERFEVSKAIFSRTINMRELYFTDFVKGYDSRYWDLFDSVRSKMNLERLSLYIGEDSQYLVPILRTLPRLKHLGVGGPQISGLQKTDLPELKSLRTTLSRAAAIVPGRPVEKLELIDYNYVTSQNDQQSFFDEDLFGQLSLSACDIADFTVRLLRPWDDEVIREGLRLVARSLPRIQRLRVFVCGMVSESVLLEVLPAFSSLRHLRLIGAVVRRETYEEVLDETNHSRFIICGPQDLTRFDQELKELCPSLIDIEWCHREREYCCLERSG